MTWLGLAQLRNYFTWLVPGFWSTLPPAVLLNIKWGKISYHKLHKNHHLFIKNILFAHKKILGGENFKKMPKTSFKK